MVEKTYLTDDKEQRAALVRSTWFTKEEVEALSAQMVEHYYNILYYGD